MAVQVITREIEVCNRCPYGKQLIATQSRTYALEDRYYEIPLCDTHAEMFDRDYNKWVMLSEEIDNPYVNESSTTSVNGIFSSQLDEQRRLRELKEVAAVKERERIAAEERQRAANAKLTEDHARKVIPGSMKWKITQHAYMRMVQRGVSVFDVLKAAAQPEQTYYQPHRGELLAIHQCGHVRIAVNEDEKVIITVIDRDVKFDDKPQLAAAAH